jgi:hypothetical protein
LHGCHKWATVFTLSDWSEQFFTWPSCLNIDSVKRYSDSLIGSFIVSYI